MKGTFRVPAVCTCCHEPATRSPSSRMAAGSAPGAHGLWRERVRAPQSPPCSPESPVLPSHLCGHGSQLCVCVQVTTASALQTGPSRGHASRSVPPGPLASSGRWPEGRPEWEALPSEGAKGPTQSADRGGRTPSAPLGFCVPFKSFRRSQLASPSPWMSSKSYRAARHKAERTGASPL